MADEQNARSTRSPQADLLDQVVWDNLSRFWRESLAPDERAGFAILRDLSDQRTRIVIEGEWLDRDGVFDRGFPAAPGLLDLTAGLPPERFLGDPADNFRNETRTITARLTHEFSDDVLLRVGGVQDGQRPLGRRPQGQQVQAREPGHLHVDDQQIRPR